MKKKEVGMVLSALFPGLGQVYIGEWITGLIVMAIWTFFGIIKTLPMLIMFSVGMISFDAVKWYVIVMGILWVLSVRSVPQTFKIREEQRKKEEEKANSKG